MDIEKFLRLFKKTEIAKKEVLNYSYTLRKKIVTFVPLQHVDKLTFEMSFAGAGKIGNYDMCSFRLKGLGTFRPGSGSKPFSGKKGKLAFEEEVRLEVECGPEKLDNVIDALLANHPYEEVAYEVYDFQKRTGEPASIYVCFKNSITLKDIVHRINKKINPETIKNNFKIKNLCFTNNDSEKAITPKAKELKCNLIIISEKNKIKFKNI
jgi:hypothetical protein